MSTAIAEIAPPEQAYPYLRDRPEYGSPAKTRNYYRMAEALSRGDLIVDGKPVRVRLEPDARCNLRCCWAQRNPRHPGLRPRGAASLDLARRIIDQLGDCLYVATLHHWGEPTLHPQLPEFARLFHEAGIFTGLHTNMTLMTAEMAAGLVEAGLDVISASIDGVTQTVYEQYRINGKVDRALAGLRHVVEQRRRLGRDNPRITWQYLVFPHNVHEIGEARRLAGQIGVDAFEAFAGGSRYWTPEQGFTSPPPRRRPEPQLCVDPWQILGVDWDGAVHLCCRAFQAKHVMGHMDEDSLPAIFNNDRFQLARRVVRDGTWHESDGAIPCTGCNRVKHFVPEIASLGHVLTLE